MDVISQDLFDTPTEPSPARLAAIFDAWAASAPGKGAPLRSESAAVYRDMWMALVKWAAPKNINVAAITAAELEAFLSSRGGPDELAERYAWRFLRLVERVLHTHVRGTGGDPNQAVAELLARRPDIKHANASDKDGLPDFLDAGEARALVAALSAPTTGRGTWQDLRNRCAVALHLGAGLTPAEVRALQVAAVMGLVSGTKKIRVPANGNVAEHEAPVAPWAWRLVEEWMSMRKALGIAGNAFLPATRAGREWGKTAHHDAVGSVLSSVGLPAAGGAYRLRHTFALRQLKRGRTHAEVAQWLGIDEAATSRYRRLLPGPVEVV